MKKVLFFATIDPSARNNGKSVVLSGIFDFLQEKYADQFELIVVGDSTGNAQVKATIGRPSRPKILGNIIYYTLWEKTKSIQECFFYAQDIASKLQSKIDKIVPDIVIFDTVRLAQYIPGLNFKGAKKIVYLDDLFSLRYTRMAASNLKAIGVFGNFEKNIPSALRFVVDKFDPIKKFVLRYEARMIEKSEVAVVKNCDLSLLISSSEVIYFKDRHGAMKLTDIPPYLPMTSPLARQWNGEPNFVFLGSMNLPHNVGALKVFLESVFPSVLARNPSAKLAVVGGGASDELSESARSFGDKVRFLGRVDDLAPVLSNACALIAPLAFGSGVKLKIIDALASSLPIISTDVGVEGIDFVHGVHGELANDWDQFADAVLRLCDIAKNEEYAQNCKKLFVEKYAKQAIFSRYADIFE